jgi:hypothetical protein
MNRLSKNDQFIDFKQLKRWTENNLLADGSLIPISVWGIRFNNLAK